MRLKIMVLSQYRELDIFKKLGKIDATKSETLLNEINSYKNKLMNFYVYIHI